MNYSELAAGECTVAGVGVDLRTIPDPASHVETIGEMPCESCGVWTEARIEELGPGVVLFCYYCPLCGHEVGIDYEEKEWRRLKIKRWLRRIFHLEKRYTR